MSKRYILLGGSGFIGRNLKTNLEESGATVLAPTSQELNLMENDSVKKLAEMIQEGDGLIMLSALTPDRGKGSDTLLKNIQMAVNVDEAIKGKKISQFVYCSSDAVYENGSSISEATAATPQDMYGSMHLSREKIFEAASGREGFAYTVVRPCPVFGFGDTHNSYGPNRFIKQALSGDPISLFGKGEENRDHIYIDDLVQLFSRVLNEKKTGILNLAAGKSLPFWDVAKMVVDFSGKSEIKTSDRQNEITHRHYNNERVYEWFPGFQYTEFSSALKTTIERAQSM